MKCKYCNADIEQDAQFCPNCGKNLSMFNKCVKCGELLDSDASFCPHCGTEQPHYEEDNGSKKWLWVICAVLGIGLIAGGLYFFSLGKTPPLNSHETEMVSADSSEMDEIIAKRITDIYNDVFSGNGCANADSKYCSKGYLSLAKEFEEAYANSNIDEIMGLDYDHWTLTNEEAVNPSMRIISISKQSDKDVIAKVHISYGQVENSGGDVSLRLIFENGNWFIDDFIHGDYSEKEGFQEDIKQFKDIRKNNKKICESYIQKLNEYAKGEYERCEYFLFDITKDGIPELWIVSGNCEADYELTTYTHELKKICQKSAMHSGFCKGNDYILQVGGHMGYSTWIRLYYDGNKIQEKIVFEEGPVEEYTEPKENSIDFIPYNNITPIKNAFNQ